MKLETKMWQLFKLVERDYLINKHASTYWINLQVEGKLDPALGQVPANKLSRGHVEAYKDKRLAEGSARSTINLELSTIRRALKLGLDRDLHENRLTVRLYPIGNSNKRVGFFEEAEYDAMLKVCNPDMRDVLMFGHGSGWRLGEILPLTWQDNFDHGANVIRIFTSKSGKGRSLPLDALGDVSEMLQMRLFTRKDSEDASSYIFSHKGGLYNAKSFNRHWQEACRETGVSRHFHDMRRTVVRNLTRAGVHRAIAKGITGHQTDSIFDRYDICTESDITAALKKVTNYRESAKPHLSKSVSKQIYIPEGDPRKD